jgi:dihydrofolate reductase
MKVILIAAISADGKIAADEGQSSLTWTSKEDTKFFVSKTKEIGTVVMGRKTFETIGKPLKGRRIIVMTRNPRPPLPEGEDGGVGAGTVEFTAEEPQALLARLEKEGVTAVVIAGGAQVYRTFLDVNLVDEMFLTIEPVLFGSGMPLVDQGSMKKLELLDSSPLGPGVLLHFRILSS